ncbi:MAG: hypothetical protein HY360_25160 [Verrucomicrobia bacterium]|nr:hypothetical protein [Verrucomicrobiota bacterium]
MRIAALQCNFEEGQTLAVADRWKQIGFNVEQVFHPMADSYSALFDLKQHGALLEGYLARLKRNGLHSILYLNVHVLGPSLAHMKDDWAQRGADGGFPLFYDTYHPCCVNSPWRDHYFQVLRDLRPFDIDGVFLDGPVFIQDGCHCRHCRARYRREEGHRMGEKCGFAGFLPTESRRFPAGVLPPLQADQAARDSLHEHGCHAPDRLVPAAAGCAGL